MSPHAAPPVIPQHAVIAGTPFDNTLTGTATADTISGGEGADTVDGGPGDDVIYGFGAADQNAASSLITATRVAAGLDRPLYAVSAPGDPGRLFVVEQHTGVIRILDLATNTVAATPFLDLPPGAIATGGEQGLLGLAFHPDYATNGRFYIDITNAAGDTEIWEFTRSANPNVADAASGRLILTYDHPPATNHNGGWIGFGPDGYLYIATGDGGGGGDPNNYAQNLNSPLGKILRIDVDTDAFPGDATRNYAIPADNPFVGRAGLDEIYHYGLRNPWRASFDPVTGDFWVADVGQGVMEEVNFVAAGTPGGVNFGWKVKEGSIVYDDTVPGNPSATDPSLHDPIAEYRHGNGDISVTGGYVYRGPGGAQGQYFFADFGSGRIWSLREDGGATEHFDQRNAQIVTDAGAIRNIASFAVDGTGRLYVIGIGGEIHRLTPGVAAGDVSDSLSGGAGNDSIYGGVGDDTLTGGEGVDRLFGGIGDDTYVNPAYGEVVEAANQGFDRIVSAVSFSLATMPSVERLELTGAIPGFLRGNDNANTLIGNTGSNTMEGFAGNDTILGLGGRDTIIGGLGRDTIAPGIERDTVKWNSVAESTGSNRDTISEFVFAVGGPYERLDFHVTPTAVRQTVTVGTLNEASFDGDLQNAVTAARLGAGQAVLFDPNGGDLNIAGHIYLIVDANGIAGYQAGQDYVVQFTSTYGALTLANFI